MASMARRVVGRLIGVAALLACLMLTAVPARDSLFERVAAFNRGDYAAAGRAWRPTAEQGVGDIDLAVIQNGDLDPVRRLQRKPGLWCTIPVVVGRAIPTKPLHALSGYRFVPMPPDNRAALGSLVEAVCQAVDTSSTPQGVREA